MQLIRLPHPKRHSDTLRLAFCLILFAALTRAAVPPPFSTFLQENASIFSLGHGSAGDFYTFGVLSSGTLFVSRLDSGGTRIQAADEECSGGEDAKSVEVACGAVAQREDRGVFLEEGGEGRRHSSACEGGEEDEAECQAECVGMTFGVRQTDELHTLLRLGEHVHGLWRDDDECGGSAGWPEAEPLVRVRRVEVKPDPSCLTT